MSSHKKYERKKRGDTTRNGKKRKKKLLSKTTSSFIATFWQFLDENFFPNALKVMIFAIKRFQKSSIYIGSFYHRIIILRKILFCWKFESTSAGWTILLNFNTVKVLWKKIQTITRHRGQNWHYKITMLWKKDFFPILWKKSILVTFLSHLKVELWIFFTRFTHE